MNRSDLTQRLKHTFQHPHDLNAEGAWESLARDLFVYQYEQNAAYRRFCDGRGVRPQTLASWRDVPAVATDVFRHVPLYCGEPSEAPFVFRTSGTTSGRRGQHFLSSLNTYHTNALFSIRRFLLPHKPVKPLHILALAPSPVEVQDSSLSSMMGLIVDVWSDAQSSAFAWDSDGLNVSRVLAWCRDRERDQEPSLMLTTSFALVQLFDAMRSQNISFRLPTGTIVMPTGGTKGKTRTVTPEEVEDDLVALFGVARTHIVSEYGMTELGSQFYDPRLRAALGLEDHPNAGVVRALQGPPWCRVTVHEPLTGRPVPQGEVGLLCFFDLVNVDSVCRIQTSDLGRIVQSGPQGDTIELLGRDPDSVPRGCSLAVEETWEGP